jgi:hypothetical protein
MSREATPLSGGWIEARILRSGEWAVYDFDDAMWADRRGGIHRVFPKPTKWRRAVEAPDCVIAGNDYLANAAQSLNRNVVVIPSCVEPADYPKKGSYELPERPTFVWLGSASTEIHLSAIAPPLLELNRRSEVLDQIIPFDTEMYVNFHLPGIIVGNMLLAALLAFYQGKFIKGTNDTAESCAWCMFAPWTVFPGSLPVISQIFVHSFLPIYAYLFAKKFWPRSNATGALPADRVAPVPELVRSGA